MALLQFPIIEPKIINLSLPEFTGLSQGFINSPDFRTPIQETESSFKIKIIYPGFNSSQFSTMYQFWLTHDVISPFKLNNFLDSYRDLILDEIKLNSGLRVWRFESGFNFSYISNNKTSFLCNSDVNLVSSHA